MSLACKKNLNYATPCFDCRSGDGRELKVEQSAGVNDCYDLRVFMTHAHKQHADTHLNTPCTGEENLTSLKCHNG